MPELEFTRRSMLGGGVVLAALTLAACGSNSSDQSSAASGGTQGATETKLRDNSGYHLNDLTDGAPTVILYTDYQCPYCKKAEPAYEEAAGQLAGVMNVTVKNFPLPMHSYAVYASCAVQAAENQGQHLAMVHKIFEEQDSWEKAADADTLLSDYFASYASDLGLDTERFKTDYSSESVLETVKSDYQSGQDSGVQGTPSFVVEGKVLETVDSSTSVSDMVSAFKSAAGL